ncbi:MAG: hypothetical protein KY452_09560, partial [Actinobacteria bacterium]|nr:hypothetical protein [Actinomycetota bacterium]
HFPIWASLLVISAVLTVAIWLSIRADTRDGGKGPDHVAPDPDHPGSSAEPDLADPASAPAEALEPMLDIHQHPSSER